MKTLKNHVILYDDECPLCRAYTNGFVMTKMIDENARISFTSAKTLRQRFAVDDAKACDEIALVDTQSGRTLYGVDSLMHILANRYPFLTRIFRLPAFDYFVRKLYAFISYNRKVIIPGKDINAVDACRPSFNSTYRVAYLLFTWIATSIILSSFTKQLAPLIPPTNVLREFFICGGQILFQAMIITIINRKMAFEYLGNMMTISFAGALLLAVAMIFNLNASTAAGYFMVVVSLMFAEHVRRIKLLDLPWLLTFSWVMYRFIVLAFLI